MLIAFTAGAFEGGVDCRMTQFDAQKDAPDDEADGLNRHAKPPLFHEVDSGEEPAPCEPRHAPHEFRQADNRLVHRGRVFDDLIVLAHVMLLA